MEDVRNEEELNLIDIMSTLSLMVKAVRKLWAVMFLIVVAAAVFFTVFMHFRYEPEFKSKATFSVNTEASSMVGHNDSGLAQVKESLPYILQTDVMKHMVMEDLGLETFPATVELTSKENVNMFEMTVTTEDAQLSYEILQDVLKRCPEASVYVLGRIQIDILEEPGIANGVANQQSRKRILMEGAGIGVVICLVIALLVALTSRTIQKEEDFKKYLSVSCLATIPKMKFKKRRKKIDKHLHIQNDKVSYAYQESIRTLRARVIREAQQHGGAILVTSAMPGEGKTTVAANLALSLAERGKRTILVDLDFRNPSVGKVLGLEEAAETGLSDALKERKHLDQLIYHAEGWGLDLLFVGKSQNDPSRILNHRIVQHMIEKLRESYDYVILDTPPAAMLADASVLAKYADCAVLVVRQGHARMERIVEAMDALTIAKTPILGAALNGVEGTFGNSGYGNGYRYGKYGAYGDYSKSQGDEEYVDVR